MKDPQYSLEEFVLWINPELLVLGAVRIDLIGQAYGIYFKAGFDQKK